MTQCQARRAPLVDADLDRGRCRPHSRRVDQPKVRRPHRPCDLRHQPRSLLSPQPGTRRSASRAKRHLPPLPPEPMSPLAKRLEVRKPKTRRPRWFGQGPSMTGLPVAIVAMRSTDPRTVGSNRVSPFKQSRAGTFGGYSNTQTSTSRFRGTTATNRKVHRFSAAFAFLADPGLIDRPAMELFK